MARKTYAETITYIPAGKVRLSFTCPDPRGDGCDERAVESLVSVVGSGAPMCPECDVEMELDDNIQVVDPNPAP